MGLQMQKIIIPMGNVNIIWCLLDISPPCLGSILLHILRQPQKPLGLFTLRW